MKGDFGFAEFGDPKHAAQAVRQKNIGQGIFVKKSNAPPKKVPLKKDPQPAAKQEKKPEESKTEESKQQPKQKFDPSKITQDWGQMDLAAMIKKSNPNQVEAVHQVIRIEQHEKVRK